ncbi:hypothetical protein SS50377_24136 [Spironucleus salmonicida]|uniref:Uncharacterized protein n=1 Tax=Spironucleus salmonicida TaxID=348837 RepID=V6M6I5_9EUKA|nr:hypothetical protein SS50377_24136 [Spironucleus salmonicida]|eukprot:EST49019.1 hypothetical protein SS50377_10711 [Spironucleus salmonicida]
MDIAALFNNISAQSLLMLESLFVSKVNPQEYIKQQTQQKVQDDIDPFVLLRSNNFTTRSIKSTNMHLRTPIMLQRPLNNRSKSVPTRNTLLKKSHSLDFQEFVSAMTQCLNAPIYASSAVFGQVCKGDPLTQNPLYQKICQGQLDILNEQAISIFNGCQIFWLDLLNFITTKTTIIQANNDVRLKVKKVPNNFCHRLTIENCQYVPQLGVYYTAGRDGLAQFWSSQNLNDIMQFQSLEEMTFGMKDEEVACLVKDWTAASDNKGLERIQNIQVLTGVVNGQIGINNIKNEKSRQKDQIKLPFQLVFSLTDPKLDKAAFPLKQDTSNYSHDLVVACRKADAPLPSGRPMPEKVWRSIKFNGGIYNFSKPQESKYGSGGGYTLYNDCKGFQRSKSQKVKRFRTTTSKKSLDDLFQSAFSDEDNNFNFFGQEHPIYKQKQAIVGKMAIEQENEEKADSDIEMDLQKHRKLDLNNFKVSGKGNAWATAMCYDHHRRKIFISSAGGKILVYHLKLNGLELAEKINVTAVGVKKIQIWERQITRLQINRIIDSFGRDRNFNILDYVPGCQLDDIPGTGESFKKMNYAVVMAPASISFINLKNNVVDLDLDVSDIISEFPGQFFSTMGIFQEKLLLGLTNGYIISLDQFSLKVVEKLQAFETEVSDLTFYYSASLLIASCLNGKISIYNYESKPHLLQELHDSGCILNVFASEKYEVFLSICSNGVITVWSSKQYNQLHKVFTNENLSVSMWDEQNGLLIVGNVWLKVFQIIGVKKEIKIEEVIQEKTIPQAHYVQVVSIINLQRPGLSLKQPSFLLEELQSPEQTDTLLLSQISQDNSPQENIQLPQKQIQKLFIKQEDKDKYYHPLPLNRLELEHRPKFLDETNPCQPQKNITDQTPFTLVNQDNAVDPSIMSLNYNKLPLQHKFAEIIQRENFNMLNYNQYMKKVETELRHNQQNVTFKRKRVFSRNQQTGQEIVQFIYSKTEAILEPDSQMLGFVTVDVEGNLRHWVNTTLLSTYQIELPDRITVDSAGYDYQKQILILNLSNAQTMLFKLVTSEIQDIFNIQNCAKAAFILSFQGVTQTNGIQTDEFTEFLKDYKPQKYERINTAVNYQNLIAISCGEFILLYSYNSRRLSQNFVENLLLSGAKIARSLIPGMNNPPSLILKGHESPIIALSAAGKKLISCDEQGVCCFWLGQGIAKYIIRLKNDYIQQVFASFRPELWGYIFFKSGELIQIDMNKGQSPLLTFQIDGNTTANFAVDERENGTIYAFSDKNLGFIFVKNEIYCTFKLPCNCKNIQKIEFCDQKLVVGCNGGHVFLNEIIRKSGTKGVFLQGSDGIIQRNMDFDDEFDSAELLQLSPLSVNIIDQQQIGSEINVETEQFFERLAQSQIRIEKTLILEQNSDVRLLSSKVVADSVQISNMLVNEDTIEVARREQMLSMRVQFK